jgi:hypothetical protein
MEDDLKIFKVEYPNNPWSDLAQWTTVMSRVSCNEVENEGDLQWNKTSKY